MPKKILVFPESFMEAMPPINGFSHDAMSYGNVIFGRPGTGFRERTPELESDPSWKQIIPYMLVKYEDNYLVYRRNKGGGEIRLHNLYSLGIGGHIEDSDGVGPIEAYMNGMQRELQEEILVGADADPSAVRGCIYDPSTPVGRVHFGFVYVIEAKSPHVVAVDTSVGLPAFMPVPFIKAARDRFEEWSKLCIDALL
jgi:predicted NUDIX family phosphoesterase